jgi:hypothetical protein
MRREKKRKKGGTRERHEMGEGAADSNQELNTPHIAIYYLLCSVS